MTCNECNMFSLTQQYIWKKDPKLFGKSDFDAIVNKMTQLDGRTCFKPISVKELTMSKGERHQ